MLHNNISDHKLVYSFLIFLINKLNKFVKPDKYEKNNPKNELINYLFHKVNKAYNKSYYIISIFQDYYCSFFIHLLQVIKGQHNKKTDSNWEEQLKECLSLGLIMIQHGTTSQIEIFLKDGGIIYLCKIFTQGVFDFDCINYFVKILQIFIQSHLNTTLSQFKK